MDDNSRLQQYLVDHSSTLQQYGISKRKKQHWYPVRLVRLFPYLNAARSSPLNLKDGLRHSWGTDERGVRRVEDDDGALAMAAKQFLNITRFPLRRRHYFGRGVSQGKIR